MMHYSFTFWLTSQFLSTCSNRIFLVLKTNEFTIVFLVSFLNVQKSNKYKYKKEKKKKKNCDHELGNMFFLSAIEPQHNSSNSLN